MTNPREAYTHVTVTLSSVETTADGRSYPTTEVLNLEFDSGDAAWEWLNKGTGIEDEDNINPHLMNFEALIGANRGDTYEAEPTYMTTDEAIASLKED